MDNDKNIEMSGSVRSNSDSALVVSVGRYDQDALAEIYRRHCGAVFALASRIANDRQIAEDVTQDVFVTLWNNPGRFDPERGTLRTFLLTVTHGRCVDIIRSESARKRREDAEMREMVDAVNDIEREVMHFAAAEEVKQAFEVLPDAEREAIEMTYFKGHTYVEAAKLLQQPEGTIKSRIRSGLQRLRHALPEVVEER